MLTVLGRGLVLAAIAAAAAGAFAGVLGGLKGSPQARLWARQLAYTFFALMLGANLLMEYALVFHDFSVSYAAQVGSRSVPLWVNVVSLWSSLEGSILFWGAILGAYVAAQAYADSRSPSPATSLSLGVSLAVGVFFAFLIAGPADPFRPLSPPPFDGPGPNPVLQNHLLMVIHPPMLYLGYVGMTVPFGLAVAALALGRLDRPLLSVLRTWLLVAWGFLTVGIVLGGWWAYEVLGWGGYWAWDPVENASLLPWLTATAALHTLLVVERRGALKGWAVTLVLSTFLLTVLGTFMTRSGVFNSVHSFSQSDIGPTFLTFLALGLVFSVVLLSYRLGALQADQPLPGMLSREGTFLLNNLVLVTLTLTVLLGTVFPLIVEAVRGARISVGEPYFNRMAVPLGVALIFLMGVGPALPWGQPQPGQARRSLLSGIPGALILAGAGVALGARTPWLVIALLVSGYALQVTFEQALAPFISKARSGKLTGALAAQFGPGRRRLGSYVIHAGVLVALVSVAASSSLRQHTEVTLRDGQSAAVGAYRLTFLGTRVEMEPHRQATVARFSVARGEKVLGVVEPRMNQYFAMREPVGTPAVLTTGLDDVYLSIMSVEPDQKLVGIRAFVNPMVSWIWVGGGIVVLGTLLVVWPVGKRAREVRAAADGVDEGATPTAPAAAGPGALQGGRAEGARP